MSCETGLADDFSMLDVGIASGDRWSGVRVQTMLARRAGELAETYLFRHVIVVIGQATPGNVTWIGGPAIDLGREGVPRGAIVFPALQPYQARWEAANTCILVELAPELIDEAGRRYGSGGHVDLRPGLAVGDRFIPSMADALVDLATRDASATLLAESLGLTLAAHLVQTRGSSAGEATGGGALAPAKLRLLAEFIEARLESAISVADLAKPRGHGGLPLRPLLQADNGTGAAPVHPPAAHRAGAAPPRESQAQRGGSRAAVWVLATESLQRDLPPDGRDESSPVSRRVRFSERLTRRNPTNWAAGTRQTHGAWLGHHRCFRSHQKGGANEGILERCHVVGTAVAGRIVRGICRRAETYLPVDRQGRNRNQR
jgi:hypothetical protein